MPEPTAEPAPAIVRRRKRRRPMPFGLRIALVLGAGGLCAYLVYGFVSRAAHPYLLGYKENQKVAALRERLHGQRAENETLRRRIAYLNSPEGREFAARKAGYHKKGETVYLMSPEALATPRPSEKTE